jgi:hypothetical protein
MPDDFSQDFVNKMRARVATSYYKYGPWAKNRPFVDCLANVQTRIKIYQDTGNTEGLVDAANFLMLEFELPKHPNAHFRATDSKEAPPINCLKE